MVCNYLHAKAPSYLIDCYTPITDGATKNAGVENAIRAKMQGWKMQEWNMQEYLSCMENLIYVVKRDSLKLLHGKSSQTSDRIRF